VDRSTDLNEGPRKSSSDVFSAPINEVLQRPQRFFQV